jgi:hypothetical protein
MSLVFEPDPTDVEKAIERAAIRQPLSRFRAAMILAITVPRLAIAFERRTVSVGEFNIAKMNADYLGFTRTLAIDPWCAAQIPTPILRRRT